MASVVAPKAGRRDSELAGHFEHGDSQHGSCDAAAFGRFAASVLANPLEAFVLAFAVVSEDSAHSSPVALQPCVASHEVLVAFGRPSSPDAKDRIAQKPPQ